AFVLDALAPRTSNNYKLTYGAAAAGPAAPAGDLKITPAAGLVQLSTSRVGVRLLAGEKTYDKPASAKDVPGPLVAMQLAGGDWAGGSHLYGDAPVKSWSSKLTDAGGVFARVATTYTFADGNTATFVASLVAGDSVVRWEVDVKKNSP